MTRLESSPSILPLYLKAAMPLIPGASSLPFLPGGGGEIPSGLGFELKGVVPQQDQVAEYANVCGFPLKDRLPPTFPHVLAFPLHMAVMSNGEFPFGAVGLVHIENSINQLRPIAFGEMLEVKVEVTSLSPHPKGQIFSLLTEVSAAGETVWTETSTMLRRGKGGQTPSAPGLEIPTLDPGTPASATWNLPADLGRRYGAVSGDRNPIHMHALTAKPLGFHSAIAHGMWTAARALAQIESRLPDSFTSGVKFRKPIFLPARVQFAAEGDGTETLFAVRDARKGTPHMDGRITSNANETAKASN